MEHSFVSTVLFFSGYIIYDPLSITGIGTASGKRRQRKREGLCVCSWRDGCTQICNLAFCVCNQSFIYWQFFACASATSAIWAHTKTHTHTCVRTFIGTDSRGKGSISPLLSCWLVIPIPCIPHTGAVRAHTHPNYCTQICAQTHHLSLSHTHTGIILMVCCCRGGRALVSFRLQATAKVLFACSDYWLLDNKDIISELLQVHKG